MNFDNKYCQKCKLYEKALSPYIIGRGNKKSGLLFIGDAPNANEDKEGQMFVGRVGRLFQATLNKLDLDCFITNTCKCRPIKNNKNRPITPTEISSCYPFTVKLILEMKPKVIVALGKQAMQQLFGMSLAIEVARNKVFYHPVFNTYIIVTWHPESLLYADDGLYLNQFNEDLLLAKSTLFSPYQRRIKAKPRSISHPEEVKAYLEYLLTVDAFAYDLETTERNPRQDKITDISFCAVAGQGVHIEWENILQNLNLFKKVMASSVKKIAHNGTFDNQFLHANDITVNGFFFDTMLASHTLSMSYEGGKVKSLYKLKTMAWYMTTEGGYESALAEGIVNYQKTMYAEKKETEEFVQGKLFTQEDLKPRTKRGRALSDIDKFNKELDSYNFYVKNKRNENLKELNITEKQYYSAMDADVTFRIFKYLKPIIDKDFSYIFYDLIMPLNQVLTNMEENGIMLNVPYMDKIHKENEEKMQEIQKKLFKSIGKEFNINSTKELKEILFKVMKIKPNKDFLTPSGAPSTNETAINFYGKRYPKVKPLLEYRELKKQNSTYIKGFSKLMEKDTHRVHPSYFQATTATGRLSSGNPNLQNVPRLNKIRNMIIPAPGYKFVSCDLSQAELRILAMISEDQNMIAAFESGQDFHTMTACNMFNIDINVFDKHNPKHAEARQVSKNINFGVAYQMGPQTLADDMKVKYGITISFEEATEFINKFYRAYPNVRRWVKYITNFAIQNGYVETIHGRRRYLPAVYSKKESIRQGAFRRAVNTPIQGTASDCTNFGAIKMYNFINKNKLKSRLVGIIHDDIIIETAEEELELIPKKLVEFMTTNIPKITIPLKADSLVLDKWEKD